MVRGQSLKSSFPQLAFGCSTSSGGGKGGTVIKEAVLDMVRFFLSWMSWSTLEHGRAVRLEEEEKEK